MLQESRNGEWAKTNEEKGLHAYTAARTMLLTIHGGIDRNFFSRPRLQWPYPFVLERCKSEGVLFLFCFVFLPLPLLRAVLSRVSRFNVRVIAPTSLAFYNSERKLESKTKCDKRSKRIAAYINIEKKKEKEEGGGHLLFLKHARYRRQHRRRNVSKIFPVFFFSFCPVLFCCC